MPSPPIVIFFLRNIHVLRLDYKKIGGESFNLAVLYYWLGGEAWNSTGNPAKGAQGAEAPELQVYLW